MNQYSVVLKPVYSCPTEENLEGVDLPEGWTLSWHQAETFKALSNPEIDIVFNTAMTGDGKSLAAYLKAMTGRNYTLAMYPTNELARDQERQVESYKTQFQPKDYDPDIFRLTGAILEDLVEAKNLSSKQQGILYAIENAEILLTNPDIFHYIHSFRYLRRSSKNPNRGDNADKIFRKIDELYKIFIFDEFHILPSPQVTSILNSILLMRHTTANKKFLFLSATPNESLLDFLHRVDLKFRVINPVDENKYCFSLDSDKENWRAISQSITLTFPSELEPKAKASYQWLVNNAESTILQFFLDYPGSKGAIILNSIASVYKLSGLLKPLFSENNLQVLTNTSLTGKTERSQSLAQADLLIGTSTIDVGVDFKINFLVFEASDSGNFIQRFGRLGRHPDFLPRPYQAYALIPNFLVSRLFGEEGSLKDTEECNRISFNQAICDNWSFINQFESYPQRWGSVQSWYVWNELSRDHMKKVYLDAAENFKTDTEKVFQFDMLKKKGQVHHCIQHKKKKVIAEALSFRGSSQLDCAIYDAMNPDEPEPERFKTYHLPGLLSNFVFETMDKDDFLQRVQASGLPQRRFQDALYYLKLKDYREVRENWYFYYAQDDFDRIKQSNRVQVLKKLELEGTAIPTGLRRAISRRGLVCCISEHDRTTLRVKYGLPMQFQAYGLSDRIDDPKPPYTIAFGQSALMLETLIWYQKPRESIAWIC